MLISWSLLCCTILQAAYNVDMLVVTLLHNIVDSVLCRYLGRYFAAQYFREHTMQISWSLLCCTIMQAAYYVEILGRYFAAQYCRQRTMQIILSLHCCKILQGTYNVDMLVVTLLHNIVGSVLCRYLGRYFAAQYCRERTMQISWSLLCCTIMYVAYYVDILVITQLHNTVGCIICIYLGHQFDAQYCRQRTSQISWSLLYCTILQATYYVDILVITLLHNIVGSKLYRYLVHYFDAQYCRQRTMQISWSLLYAAQYCRQRTMQISWSLLCCTILQAAYYIDMLVITLLHNYCRQRTMQMSWILCCTILQQRTMQISWSLLCCTILQSAYYVDILVVTLLHNIVDSVLFKYLGPYFAAQYCSSVLCRYLGHYFAAQ